MIEDFETIRRAAQVLAVRDPALQEELLHACETIWERVYEASEWPAEFEARAKLLKNRLERDGSVEQTLDALDEAAADDLAHAIVRFAADINAKNGAAA